jgi:hypothetical protein
MKVMNCYFHLNYKNNGFGIDAEPQGSIESGWFRQSGGIPSTGGYGTPLGALQRFISICACLISSDN